jgi:quinohemoprotein ethanol dehydrogenase
LNPAADYGKTGNGWWLVGFQSHVWYPMSFSPLTGLVYLPTFYGSFPYVAEAGAKMGNQLLSINIAKCPQMPAPKLEGAGSYLVAWDPVKQKAAWTQREGNGRSGTMTTAGNLVFQGTTTEEAPHNHFTAFRADNGERVWSVDSQAQIVGGSATYSVDGVQYVAVVAAGTGGFGGSYWQPNYARLLVYKLGGKVTLPPTTAFTPPVLNPPPEFGTDALRAHGESEYNSHCASCHGTSDIARVSSLFPDLRYAGALWSPDAFKAIVIDGGLQADGMVSFRKVLTTQDAEAIRAYVVQLANQAKKEPAPAFPFPGGRGRRGFGCMPPPAAAPAGARAPSAPGSGAATPQQPTLHE